MTPRIRALAIAAMVLAFGAMFAGTASAHTKLVASDPAKDAKVSSLSEVSLTFNESVTFVKVVVRDGKGGQHQSGKPVVEGGKVTQKLTGALNPGSYQIAYRVVSADGHPVQATVPFSVVAQALGNGASPSAQGNAWGAGAGVVQATPGPKAAVESSSSSGATKWFIGGAGLVAGIGLGLGFVIVRSKKKQPASAN
jgi:methionine-rich copper-binding protein CopC